MSTQLQSAIQRLNDTLAQLEALLSHAPIASQTVRVDDENRMAQLRSDVSDLKGQVHTRDMQINNARKRIDKALNHIDALLDNPPDNLEDASKAQEAQNG